MDKLIKAKFTKDGEPYGRQYTYLTKEDVQYGQKVYADTQHGEAELIVTDVNIPKSEVPEDVIPKLKYIHTAKQEEITTEGLSFDAELVLPSVKINYEELKAELENKLKEYSTLVITEETLPGCKAAQKELTGLRNTIDRYRKDKKKELEAPIKVFEAQCKDLVALIEKVEQPIKEGIQVYDNAKKDDKREKAETIIAEVVESAGLNEKYANRLFVVDKYTNLTATEKAVREDVETRAFALRVEQEREQERLDIIQSVIDSENERITAKMDIIDFQNLIDSSNFKTKDIIATIKGRAERIYAAEHPAPKEEPNPEPVQEQKPEPVKSEIKQEEPEEPQPMYKVVIDVREPVGRIRELGGFLKNHGYNYTVIEQTRL